MTSTAHGPARNLRHRRSKPELYGEWAEDTKPKANGLAKSTPAQTPSKATNGGVTDYGKQMDKKLDEHQS
jgi:hypothetical protein